MGRGRARLLGALIAYLALVVASMLVMDWFVVTATGGSFMGGSGKIGIGLRSLTICQETGPCVSVSFKGIAGRGMYPMLALATFWGTIVISALVLYQAGTRILSGVASSSLSKLGTFGALSMVAAAGAAGFLFGPEIGSTEAEVLGINLERTWAPVLLVLAHIVGIVTMQWAVAQETLDDAADYKPTTPVLPEARLVPPSQDIVPVAARPPIVRKPTDAEAVAADRLPSTPVPTMPDHLRKKLNYTALSADVTRAGINARREDGRSLLVLWRDVVGVVARRLPPEHDGATFVDVVSTAGATLRILPWTRLTGDALHGADCERARSLIAFVVACCASLELDARTKAFTENADAAQLPDLEKLAAHDARLA